eukprot:TRINITY_DN74300_c0_g1_i1.p1 TRINITY_DN74300_c0_g1~~TRINITY_DN74300_c0_g1_i1.p1  ORF type:complete len:211 (-),score=36.04 TRINITY_DN74300_c0_g1_i1:320-952(-)
MVFTLRSLAICCVLHVRLSVDAGYVEDAAKILEVDGPFDLLSATLGKLSDVPDADDNSIDETRLDLAFCISDDDREIFVGRMTRFLELLDKPTDNPDQVKEVLKAFASSMHVAASAVKKPCAKADIEGRVELFTAVQAMMQALESDSLRVEPKVMLLGTLDLHSAWADILQALRSDYGARTVGWRIGRLLKLINRATKKNKKTARKSREL